MLNTQDLVDLFLRRAGDACNELDMHCVLIAINRFLLTHRFELALHAARLVFDSAADTIKDIDKQIKVQRKCLEMNERETTLQHFELVADIARRVDRALRFLLEAAYLDRFPHDFKLTKNISLLHFDPLVLLTLRDRGTTAFSIPQVFFDFEFPAATTSIVSAPSPSPFPAPSAPMPASPSPSKLESSASTCR
ncbi:hypothetical protein B0T25DRAFT_567753 [Lasiosphaeria hispida]|uniref:Tc toxin complex TcA C-terminal TcB-binding domain-containing protein n=1 Tax=Lasiosphaeria hispida TaxID=260671 RepID=A0AAJ0MDH6_9PEZI|nr:hypothetical protein B0T25DRAFT_567753 [Lasiosphaeria hispida]